MERPERLPNKHWVFCLVVFLTACADQPDSVSMNDPEVTKNRGIIYYDEKPYSGILREYNSDGTLDAELQLENGKKNGLSIYYWTNSNVKREANYLNGIYHGTVVQYYETGQLFSRFNYEHGQEKGLQQMWKSDGRLKANYEVINGRKYGLTGVKNCINVWEDTLSLH